MSNVASITEAPVKKKAKGSKPAKASACKLHIRRRTGEPSSAKIIRALV